MSQTPLRSLLLCVLTLTALAPLAEAQTRGRSDAPAHGRLQDWIALKDTMLKIADAMPADKFAYRATPAERTWLADSFDYGAAALTEQTDRTMLEAAANTRFDRFMGPSVKARVVYFVIGHTWDIYGQMVVNLRLNGITPPASQRF